MKELPNLTTQVSSKMKREILVEQDYLLDVRVFAM